MQWQCCWAIDELYRDSDARWAVLSLSDAESQAAAAVLYRGSKVAMLVSAGAPHAFVTDSTGLLGWVAGTQDVKPGAKMPSTLVYTGIEQRALSASLASHR